VQAFACDLDGTLIGRDGLLRPRTLAAIARAQAAGIPVLVATGRMFRSVARYLGQAGIRDPVVCYQGAAVVDPTTGEFLLHEPLELDIAREAITALLASGVSPNVYVDDRLYVAEETEYSRAYSGFQHLPVTEVGDLLAWLEEPPTKLVAVAEPERLAQIRPGLERAFAGRVFVTTSLPHMLELGHLGASKGSGIAFVARLLGLDLAHVVGSPSAGGARLAARPAGAGVQPTDPGGRPLGAEPRRHPGGGGGGGRRPAARGAAHSLRTP
jgi:Cof subfamily protein (haloacid dehalogenase superfamily)